MTENRPLFPTAGIPTPGKQVARLFEPAEGEPGPMPYWLFLPGDYDAGRQQRWPFLLFLHGAGERGDDWTLVKKHGPPKLADSQTDFPFVLVSPQCPRDLWWDDDGLIRQLARLVDAIGQELAIDPNRLYLTGLSMGGYGVWKLACEHPQRYAALAPICGGGDPTQAHKLASMPIWAFHGALDDVVPQEQTIAMIEGVEDAGGQPRLTIYPDVAHDSWTITYDNPQLYEWLLAQRRPD